MAGSCDNIPQAAALRVKGNLNGQNLHNVIAANITDMGPRRAVSATIKDIIKQQVCICFFKFGFNNLTFFTCFFFFSSSFSVSTMSLQILPWLSL
jgi:hypothetical protein